MQRLNQFVLSGNWHHSSLQPIKSCLCEKTNVHIFVPKLEESFIWSLDCCQGLQPQSSNLQTHLHTLYLPLLSQFEQGCLSGVRAGTEIDNLHHICSTFVILCSVEISVCRCKIDDKIITQKTINPQALPDDVSRRTHTCTHKVANSMQQHRLKTYANTRQESLWKMFWNQSQGFSVRTKP